ncbi:MAG: ABC transporter permease, partial [Acidobacteriaceae bacterium]
AQDRANAEIAAELESHLQLHIDDNLRAGMTPTEARRQALIQLGGLEQTRQAVRERSTVPWLENLAQDLKFALRQLRKSPGFACIVIVILALGIGANTALFSIVNAVLLHPIAQPHPDELVTIDAARPHFENGSISYPNFLDWQRDNRSFSAVAVSRHQGFVMTGDGDAERVRGNLVSANFFSLLGVRPVVGRLFAPHEDEIGRAPIILLGGGFWARRFGSDPNIVGHTLTLDDRSYTIVGVIPASFDLTYGNFLAEDIYIPMGQLQTQALQDRGASLDMQAIARLRPGVTIAQARADMNNVSAQLAAQYPDDDRDLHAKLTPLRTVIVGDVQPILFLLLAAVGFVLLIACANVANLLLARSTARAQEFGVRLALGAGRRRIVTQVLTESTVLALLGGLLGLGVAALGSHAAVALVPDALPSASHIHLSSTVLGFTLAVSCAVGILFGLIPAWKIAAQNPQAALLEGGSRTVHGNRHRAQDALVVFQVAAALVLLAGAGLTIRSLVALGRTSPGFDPNGVLRFSVAAKNLPEISTADGARAYRTRLEQQILSVPGVSAVSLAEGGLPMAGDNEAQFGLQSDVKPTGVDGLHSSLLYIVEPGYWQTMRIRLLRGRWFTDADDQNAPRVVVIDEDLAHQYFGSADPVGKLINLSDPTGAQATVIGVVGHVLQYGLDNDAGFPLRAEMYLPLEQVDNSTGSFFYDVVVRADHPETIFPDIETTLHRMNAGQVAWRPLTMNQIIGETLAARRFSMVLFGAFAALALLLAAVGLYGVISYLVGQRTREMAVRMALGADRADVLRLVLRRGAVLAGVGVAVGTVVALLVTRAMARIDVAGSSLIYGIAPWDPLTIFGTVTLLMLIALAASYIPARRAASVDPMQALRSE